MYPSIVKGGFDMWSKSAELLNPYEEIISSNAQINPNELKNDDNSLPQTDSEQ